MVAVVAHCVEWLVIQQQRWTSIYLFPLQCFVHFVSCLLEFIPLYQCCQNLGCLCTNSNQKYGDQVTEEKERMALLSKGKGETH